MYQTQKSEVLTAKDAINDNYFIIPQNDCTAVFFHCIKLPDQGKNANSSAHSLSFSLQMNYPSTEKVYSQMFLNFFIK